MKEKVTFQELMGAFHIGDTICNDAVYRALLEQMKGEARIVPVIGAGLSCWAGYPLWGGLLKKMADGLDDEDAKQNINRLLEQEEYEQAAQVLEEIYLPNTFHAVLKEEFTARKLSENSRPEYQERLPELFKGPFVTTNFDVSLERLLKTDLIVTPEDEFPKDEIENRIQQRKSMLVKLHGSVADVRHMILTKDRYDKVYGPDPERPDNNKTLPRTLKMLFGTYQPLFLGCGLGKDRTCAVFRASKGAEGFALLELPEQTKNAGDPFHPILKKEGKDIPELYARRKYLDELNIKVIWYPSGEHDAVRVLIEQLAADLGLGGGPAVQASERAVLQSAQYARAGQFIGRETQVQQVVDWLRSQTDPILLLHGPSGIGKTAICKEAYRRRKAEQPELDMPLVDLIGAGSITDFQARLAKGLGIALPDLAPEDVQAHLLTEIAGRGACFAYLDNFEVLWNKLKREKQRELSVALRRLTAVGLHLLISSQVSIPRVKTIRVGTLDGDIDPAGLSWDDLCALERTKLFLATLGREPKASERGALATLVRETEGHPLAIVLTARAGSNCLLNGLLTRWHRIDQGEGRHDSLTRALSLAWDSVQENRAAVLRWALHAYSLFPIDAQTMEELRAKLEETISDDEWLEGEQRLHMLGLTDWDENGAEKMLLSVKKPFFDLDGAAKAAGDAALRAWAAWGGALLVCGDDRKHPDYLPRHDRALQWLPQCFSLAERCAEDGRYDDLERLLWKAGNFYKHDVARALPLLERLIRKTPEDFSLRGEFYKYYGDLLYFTGRNDEALKAYAEAEALYEKVQNDLGRANVLRSRGDLLYLTGRDDEALAAYDEAEALFKKEQNDLGRANVLSGRGNLLAQTGKHDEALAAYDEAEALYKKVQDALGRANVLRGRGELLSRAGRNDEALKAYAEAEALYKKVQYDLGRANVLKGRGNLLAQTGKHDEALAAYDEAEALYKKVQNDLGRANVLQSRGKLLARTGKHDEVLQAYAEAETLYKKVQDDLGRANVLRSRGDLLQEQGDWPGARACYEAALPLYRRVREPMGLCYTLAELQLCLRRLGEDARAEECIREAEALLPDQSENVQRYVRWKIEAGKRG